MKARTFLHKKLKLENETYFGNDDDIFINHVCDAWMNDEANSKHRYDTIIDFIGESKLKKAKILDMSSGCGTFVFYGLIAGYDVYGIEPSIWKHQFNFIKAKEKGYPESWIGRFCCGVGEALPFSDETFDIVSTYQTIEHVQDMENCFKEFKRVLKSGGALFIRCPDYASTFEGHYRIPMLPLMNRSLFKIYLKILRRPTYGLDTLNYVTKRLVLKYLVNDYEIIDVEFHNIKDRIQKKIKIIPPLAGDILSRLYITVQKTSNTFRRENNINLVAIKK